MYLSTGPSHFVCPECDTKKSVDKLAHNDAMCTRCLAKKIEDELNLYGEASARYIAATPGYKEQQLDKVLEEIEHFAKQLIELREKE